MQQEIAVNVRIECNKATRDAEKAREEAENAKSLALKEKVEAQKVIDNSKLVAEQAHIKFIEAREKAEKAKALAKVEAEKVRDINQKEAEQAKPVINHNVSQSTSLKMNPWTLKNEVECEFCDEEFPNTKLHKEHIQTCPI